MNSTCQDTQILKSLLDSEFSNHTKNDLQSYKSIEVTFCERKVRDLPSRHKEIMEAVCTICSMFYKILLMT